MPSKEHHRKRDFKKSPESGGGKGRGNQIFFIQKQDAEHLHYDLHLRLGDVLVSWVVPRGLSTEVSEKRLAIRLDDRPLEFADFGGIIPGDVARAITFEVWDHGDYEVFSYNKASHPSLREGLKKGAFKVKLRGGKFRGRYAFVCIDPEGDQRKWLIFRLQDSDPDARRNPESTESNSVITGRSLKEIKKDSSQ